MEKISTFWAKKAPVRVTKYIEVIKNMIFNQSQKRNYAIESRNLVLTLIEYDILSIWVFQIKTVWSYRLRRKCL